MKKHFPLLFFIIFTVALAGAAVFVGLTPEYSLERIGGDVLPMALVYSLPGLCALVAFYLSKWFSRSRVFALDGLSVGVDLLVLGCIAAFAFVLLFMAARGEIGSVFLLHGALRLAAVGVVAAWFCLVVAKDVAIKLKAPADGEAKWSFPSNFVLWTMVLSAIYALVGLFSIRHGYSDRMQFFTIFFLAAFWLMAAGTALCANLARRMWARSKAVALILAGVFAVVLILGNTLYLAKISSAYYYYWGSDIDRVLYEQERYMDAPWCEEGESEAEEPEQSEAGTQSQSLDILWRNPGDDTDSVSAAISYVAREIDMSGFPNGDPFPSYEMLAYKSYYGQNLRPGGTGSVAYTKIIKYLHKKLSHYALHALYRNYGHLLTELIPYSTFHERGYHRIVEVLIATYDDLDGTEGFYEIACIMGREGKSYNDYFEEIRPWAGKPTLRKFRDQEGDIDVPFAVWAYSFWGRRYNEDSAREVYQTLVDIRDSYER